MNQRNQSDQPSVSQEPQPNLQPETPKKPDLPTWAIILIIILSVIVVGLLSYGAYRYFTPQPEPEPAELPTAGEEGPADETADEQIYRNEEYGFEIDTKGLLIEENESEFGNYGVIYFNFILNPENVADFAIWHWDKNEFKNDIEGPGTFYQRIGYDYWHYFVDNFENIQTGECSQKIIEKLPISTISLPELSLCSITKNENYIKIETDNDIFLYTDKLEFFVRDESSKNREILNQILSTFKFIE